MHIGAATTENSVEAPQKLNYIESGNSTSGYIPKENKNTNSERFMHTYVYGSTTDSGQYIEATSVSRNGKYIQWNVSH